MAINTYFKNIADAIREKTGGSAFITPGQMPQAIRDIVSGGGGLIQPLLENITSGYVDSNGNWITYTGTIYNDIYLIEDTAATYLLTYNNTQPDRFRVGLFSDNIWNINKNGILPTVINSTQGGYILTFKAPTANPYLAIYKGSTQNGKTVLVKL